ncbi:MAG TPA: PAS domain-containing protein, partial [Spirochaetota bacterium]|nr:PAS domain-containing protein [Spirochaetota bacterium]
DIIVGDFILNISFYLTDFTSDKNFIIVQFVDKSRSEKILEAVSKIKAHYLLALSSAKIVPWEYDVKKKIIKNIFNMNMIFEENYFVLSLDEWQGLIHEEDRSYVLKNIEDVLASKADEFFCQYRIVTGRNNVMWLKTTAMVTERDESGNPILLSGVNQNITDLKNLERENIEREERLKENERRLKNALKLGKMVPWEYDFETQRFSGDSAIGSFFGVDNISDGIAYISRDRFSEKIYHEDRDYVRDKFIEALDEAKDLELTYRLNVNGEIRNIHFVSEVIFDDDRPVKLMGVAQDITGIKKLEQSLARQIEELRFIAEKIGLGIWTYNVESDKLFLMDIRDSSIDEELYKIYGFDNFLESIHPDDRYVFNHKLSALLSARESVEEIEVRIDFKNDGEYRWYYITSVISAFDKEGKAREIRGFYQDISERREMEEKLYHSQKMEAIGRLAGGIAHDFNNILQIILGYGSLALMDVDPESELFHNLSNIIDSGEKAKSLVRQLLLFARKEKFTPNFISVNILISGLISMLKRLIGDKISLSFISGADDDVIYGDTNQIEQILLNLCINSRDAISGDGNIVIETKNILIEEELPCVDGTIPQGRYVMITVSDDGCGIEREHINNIFEPFFTTKGKESGTGLGLSIVYSIVKQHKGYIDLFSIKGKGTVFKLYFSVAEVNEQDLTQCEKNYEPVPLRHGVILLAEDDDLVRKYTSKVLEDAGFNVIVASDGEAAVDIYKSSQEKFDLIILDVVMPKLNGWQVYNSIDGINSKIPVIFFSGYDKNYLPEDLLEKPFIRFIQKPFKYYSLLHAIHELIQ